MPSSSTEEERLRKRRHAPKVRTGCVTCKIRRVKCDETKPACLRCANTGRRCDGYPGIVPRRQRRSGDGDSSPTNSSQSGLPGNGVVLPDLFETSPELQLAPFEASYRERRALEFFYTESAPQLAGSFSSHFWNGCLLQLSISEPAIRYAMVALGTMLEAEISPSEENYVMPLLSDQAGVISSTFSIASSTFSTRLGPSREQFAVHYYNKAIQSIISRAGPGSDGRSLSVVAMTCIMFICVEFLRGNVDAALTHITSGVKMIKGFRAELEEENLIPTSVMSSFEAAFIEKEIVPLMSWLSVVAAVFGKPSGEIFHNPLKGGKSFVVDSKPRTMLDARAICADITNATIALLTATSTGKYTGSVSVEHLTEHTKLTKLMKQLQLDIEDVIAGLDLKKDHKVDLAADHLRITILAAKVWLASALTPYESAWDDAIDDFVNIVDIAERMIAKSLPRFKRHTKHFSFEAGIVPALHVTAWKCRHPILRRRAAELLFAWPRRECLFDSRHFYGVFLKLIKLEERNGTWANISDKQIQAILKADALVRARAMPNITTMMFDYEVDSLLEDLLQDLDVSEARSTGSTFPSSWQTGSRGNNGTYPTISKIPNTNMALASPEVDRVHHFMLSLDHASMPLLRTYNLNDAKPFPRTSREPNAAGSDARMHAITFLTKPEGILGPWRRFDEHIELGLFEKMAGGRVHVVQAMQLQQQCADGETVLAPTHEGLYQKLGDLDWPVNNMAWGVNSHDAPWGYRGMMD